MFLIKTLCTTYALAIEFVLIGENKSNDSFNLGAWNCFIGKVAYRRDSIKPQGAYLLELIFRMGTYSMGA